MEEVVLVDTNDTQIGTMEKLEAHQKGVLHRAFSIFIFDPEGRLLLQKRAKQKYHSGGLWTNTCCSHPRPGEELLSATHRRLMEEMGFDSPVEEIHAFVYRAELDHGLTEHEYDHVFVGEWRGTPKPDPDEVEDWRFISIKDLRQEIAEKPETYTYWLKSCLEEILKKTGRS